CDTCRKARRWLDDNGIDHDYIDLRDDGVTKARIAGWLETHGNKTMINKRSRTWRDLDDNARQACETDPLPTLFAHPTLIKRPILETGNTSLVGFSAATYADTFPTPP